MSTSASTVRIAASPVGWGVDFADSPNNPPWETGARRHRGRRAWGRWSSVRSATCRRIPSPCVEILSSRNLTSVGSFIFDDLHDPGQRDRLLAIAERVGALHRGRRWRCVRRSSTSPTTIRVAHRRPVGRGTAARRPSDGGDDRAHRGDRRDRPPPRGATRSSIRTSAATSSSPTRSSGSSTTPMSTCASTPVTSPTRRVDPGEAIGRYADRLGHVHFKDIRPDVLARVDAEALDVLAGDRGRHLLPARRRASSTSATCYAALDAAGYDGYATIEQDRVPGTGTPLDDLRQSLAVIEAARTGHGS